MYCPATQTFYPLSTSGSPGPRVFNSTQDPSASDGGQVVHLRQLPTEIIPEGTLAVNTQNCLHNRINPQVSDTPWYQFDFVDPNSLLVASDAPRDPQPNDVATAAGTDGVTTIRIEKYE
jgi:hypothetical protein